MSVSAMWIKNNMLSFDQNGRQFTEAELKVQRSIQTLTIPEWYLNKRSNPPKILTNTPVYCRPPTWKNPDLKKFSLPNFNALTLSDTPSNKSQEKPGPSNLSTGTYKVQGYQKSPSTTTEKVDNSIPHITPRRDISKTFPKMSPSRKLNNINIVLNRKPSPLKLPLEDDNPIPDASKYGTYVLTKRAKTPKKTNNDLSKSADDSKITPEKTNSPIKRERNREQPQDNIHPPEPIYVQMAPQNTSGALKTSTPKKKATEREEQPEGNIQPPEPIYAEITPKTKPKIKVRTASSAPKFCPGSLISSTIIEESPKHKRQPSENILKKLSIFEDSWKETLMRDDFEKASRSMEYRTSTLKSEYGERLSVSYEERCKSSQRRRKLLDENIRSIEPILFEPVDSPNSSISVRELVMKVESVCINERTPVKGSYLEWKQSKVPAVSKDLKESPKTPVWLEKSFEESPKTPVRLEKSFEESPKTPVRLEKSFEESPKTPVRLEKDMKPPCARPRNSRRMSIVPEDWRSIEQALNAPVQLREDKEIEKKNVESPNIRISKSRRMSIVPEDWRSIETERALNAPVELRKDKEIERKNVESPNTRISKSRRMSIVPKDWRNIEAGGALNAPVELRKDKEMGKKNAESSSSRISKPRRMSIVSEELKELREASRMLAQQREEMQTSSFNAESPAAKFFNSRRASLGSCEIKNIGKSSERKDQNPDQADSPNTRFLTSRRKSMELENLVRSKQPKHKSVVREIITTMTARAIKQAQLQKQKNVSGAQQNFVKTVVDALEKGNSSLLEDTIQESLTSTIRNVDDLGSGSESDAKSSSTPVYSNDTESSDSDGRSPILVESDDSRKVLDLDLSPNTTKTSVQKQCEEDDSVYWIPVARCKLPRTSSLLSMMSRLSANCDSSPCISPIKSDSENENAQIPWGETFKKNSTLSKNLFKIDKKTMVIDSGYSDRSDKSPVCCTTTDSNEDTQYESSTAGSNKNKITRASRRKCGIGTTFRVSKF